MPGRKPVAGADRPHILGGEGLARRDRAHGEQRAAEGDVAAFAAGQSIADLAERLPGRTAVGHQPSELVGLQRERRVRPAVGARQGEVLFDDAGAKRYGRHRRGRAGCVVGKARHHAEGLGQMRNGAQIGVGEGGRITAGAMQQDQILGAVGAGRGDGLVDLGEIGHAGGDDHRLAQPGDRGDQRQVDDLEGRDLVGRRVQTSQQVDGGLIERAGEGDDSRVAGGGEQPLMPIVGGIGGLVELIQRLAVPQSALDLEDLLVAVQRQGVGGVGLQLDGVGAGFGGDLDGAQRPVDVAQMVGRQLGDDERRLAGTDAATGDVELGQGRWWGHGGATGASGCGTARAGV